MHALPDITCTLAYLGHVHLVRDADGEDLDALTVRGLGLGQRALWFDDRLAVRDDDGDVLHVRPISMLLRKLHRSHLSDPSCRVRALALVRDPRNGVHQDRLARVLIQVHGVLDARRKAHDANLREACADDVL